MFDKIKQHRKDYGIILMVSRAAQRGWRIVSTPRRFRNLPRQLHIETTGSCNLDCEYCVLRKNMRNKKIMEFSQFRSLGPYFKYVDGVSLSGLAEPLINKDISNYIRYVKKQNRGCSVSIFTNATLLTENLCHELIDAQLDTLIFSIDAFDFELNDSIRKGSSLSNILANLRLLNEIKRKKASAVPVIFPVTVLQKKNYRQLRGILETVAELGVKRLSVNGLEPYTEDLVNNALWYPPKTPNDLPDILEDSLRFAERKGISLRLAEFSPLKPFCVDVGIPFILPNGDVTACSVLAYDRDRYFAVGSDNQILREKGTIRKKVFGNVFEESLRDIWFKEEYVSFRHNVLRKTFPRECKQCLVNHEIICVRAPSSPRSIISNMRISEAA